MIINCLFLITLSGDYQLSTGCLGIFTSLSQIPYDNTCPCLQPFLKPRKEKSSHAFLIHESFHSSPTIRLPFLFLSSNLTRVSFLFCLRFINLRIVLKKVTCVLSSHSFLFRLSDIILYYSNESRSDLVDIFLPK